MAARHSAFASDTVKAVLGKDSSATTPTTTGKRKVESNAEFHSGAPTEKRHCSEAEKASSAGIGVEPQKHRGMYKTPLRSDNTLTSPSIDSIVEEPGCEQATRTEGFSEDLEELERHGSSGRFEKRHWNTVHNNTATNRRNEVQSEAATDGGSVVSGKTNPICSPSPGGDNHELFECIKSGSIKDLEEVLSRVDPSTAEFCVFELAIEHGRADVVRILLDDGRCKPNFRRNAALRYAAARADLSSLKLLLKSECVNPGDKNNEAIRVASMNGKVEIVAALLQSDKVDPSAKDNEALCNAVEYGHEAVVKELIMDHRVDPNAVTFELLEAARIANHQKIVDYILFDRRARAKIEANKVPKQFMNDEQRRRLKRLNRLRDELDSDVDEEFLERFRGHLLRVLFTGSIEELCADSADRKVASSGESSGDEDAVGDAELCITWDSSDCEGNPSEKINDSKLQEVFEKNLQDFVPKHLQRLLRSTKATLERYKKLFQNYKSSERFQYLLEFKFNFQGEVDRDLVKSGFRPSAMKIGQVKSFPEMTLFAKNTRLEFVAKQLGRLFSERTCKTDKPSLSHAECVGVFRVLMCIYSAGSNKFVYRVDMCKEVAKVIAWSIKCKLKNSSAVLATRLERLEGKSFTLTYKEVLKELRI